MVAFPTEPTNPIPKWAYGSGALKTDPTDAIREVGWGLVSGQTYGQQPPLEYQNNEMYNNGVWSQYFKSFTDILRANSIISDAVEIGIVRSDYLVGRVATAPSAGYVGETQETTPTTVGSNSSYWVTVGYIDLSEGFYFITAMSCSDSVTSTGVSTLHIGLTTSNNNVNPSDAKLGVNYLLGSVGAAYGGSLIPLTISNWYLRVPPSATNRVYLNGVYSGSFNGRLTVFRYT